MCLQLVTAHVREHSEHLPHARYTIPSRCSIGTHESGTFLPSANTKRQGDERPGVTSWLKQNTNVAHMDRHSRGTKGHPMLTQLSSLKMCSARGMVGSSNRRYHCKGGVHTEGVSDRGTAHARPWAGTWVYGIKNVSALEDTEGNGQQRAT